MRLPTVQGVLFDVDDTLVDTRLAFGRAIGAVRATFLAHVPVEREAAMLAMWRDDVNGHYRAYVAGLLTMEEQRRRRAAELHAAFGGPTVDEVFFPEWDEVFWGTFRSSFAPHDDVPAILELLAAAGLKVGSVTNARFALQVEKLTTAGIAGVPVLVEVDTLGVGKPDARVFLEGCRRLGTDRAKTVYIGDEPEVDARGAADAGLIGIWLDRPGHRRAGEADVVVDGFHRVTGLHVLPELLGLT